MKPSIPVLITILLVALPNLRADAAFIESTDPLSPGGTNNVTTDLGTSLDWLDLTASQGISYDDIEAQFGSGGTYEGWRHATFSEVLGLFTGTGGLILGTNPTVNPQAVTLVGLVGVTQTSSLPNATAARGVYNDDATGTFANLSGIGQVIYQSQTIVNPAQTTVNVMDDQPFQKNLIPGGGTGHWLVRATLPEPAAGLLVGLGVAALGLFRQGRSRATR